MDASGVWGCGSFWEGQWFQWAWSPQWAHLNIMVKELTPIVLSCVVWGHQFSGKQVLFLSVTTPVWSQQLTGTTQGNRRQCVCYTAYGFLLLILMWILCANIFQVLITTLLTTYRVTTCVPFSLCIHRAFTNRPPTTAMH